jgi:hypothetical protein
MDLRLSMDESPCVNPMCRCVQIDTKRNQFIEVWI